MSNTSNTILSTRLLPGLKSEYAIVALPGWAWIWIDDYVRSCYDNDFKLFMFDTARVLNGNDAAIEPFLCTLAQDLRDFQLRDKHYLANDNVPSRKQAVEQKQQQKWNKKHKFKDFQFPTIFQLFKFIAHATDMQTIWQRRNYDHYN